MPPPAAHPRPPRWLPLGLALTFPGLLVTAAPEAAFPSAPAFAAAAAFDFTGAAAALPSATVDPSRDAALARALLLITTPPQTAARLDDAARQLAALAAPPAADAIAAEAAYQRARLAHTRGELAGEALIALYREVWTRFPGTLSAERAFVFAAVERQHRAEPADAKRGALLAWDAEAATRLRSDVARRLYHLTASMAWGRVLHDDAQACAHLKIVYALGLSSEYAFSDVIFRLGEYHRRAGDRPAAARYFREFVARYPADRRTDLARRLAAALAP